MYKNRDDEKEFRRIADKLGLDSSDVRGAVHSFFDSIFRESKFLPFDDIRKIYEKDKFASYGRVHCIPFIGRIGPVYSRYLKWRANEAASVSQKKRDDYKTRFTQDDIEHIAEVALSGGIPSIKKRKTGSMYDRVWVVGKTGKKLARQVIPK